MLCKQGWPREHARLLHYLEVALFPDRLFEVFAPGHILLALGGFPPGNKVTLGAASLGQVLVDFQGSRTLLFENGIYVLGLLSLVVHPTKHIFQVLGLDHVQRIATPRRDPRGPGPRA